MSTFKFNQGTMSNEELEKRSKFWSKEQFRTWGKEELEKRQYQNAKTVNCTV